MGWSPIPGGESNGNRGQSETIAVVLIIGIALIATTAIIAFGSTALESTEEQARNDRAEDAMTQFDSRAAEVALGDSEVQSVDFGQQSGNYEVRENAGSITIIHANYDGTDDDGNDIVDGNGDDEEVYTGTLGSMVYHNGETEIAYQGGGVWRKDPSGDSVMVSPPEFHYKAGTLTLPVIQTSGDASRSGGVRAVVKDGASLKQEFPNKGTTYSDGTTKYLNPLSQGNVYIVVESDYYMAWAEFFRSRSDGSVTVDHAKQEVKLELLTKGSTGTFPIPPDSSNGGGSLEVRGIEPGHTLHDFDYTIVSKDNQNSGFNNLRWSMYADEGNQRLEIAFKTSAQCGTGDKVKPVIYYAWKEGGVWKYESWKSVQGFSVWCTDADGDGKDRVWVNVDFFDPAQEFQYFEAATSDLVHFKKESWQDPSDLDGHPGADAAHDHSTVTVNDGDVRDASWVIQHYFAVMGPRFELQTADQQSGGAAGIDEGFSASNGYVDYPGGDKVVTYLHITENHVVVEFESD